MSSIFKKIKSLSKNGIEPINRGKTNYILNDIDVELKAFERFDECSSCVNFVDEPIDFLKIKDERITGLSDKMCNECGCGLPYLLRQDIKICNKWKE